MKPQIEKITPAPSESFRFFTKHDTGFPFKWHCHPEYELTLIEHSRGRRFVGDHIGAYHDGELVLLGPRLPHTWLSAGAPPRRGRRHDAIVVQFDEQFLGADFFQRPELARVRRLLRQARQGLQFTGVARDRAAGLLREMATVEGLPRLTLLLAVLDLLARVSRPRRLASAAFQALARPADEERISRICAHITAHQERRLTLPAVARLAHMSPASLSRYFKRTTGKTFTAYLNELRIGHACQLLTESDQTVAEICFAVGFNNLANFNRRFRQLKRQTPREYRRSFG